MKHLKCADTAGGDGRKAWWSHFGNIWQIFIKLMICFVRTHTSYPRYLSREMKANVSTKTCRHIVCTVDHVPQPHAGHNPSSRRQVSEWTSKPARLSNGTAFITKKECNIHTARTDFKNILLQEARCKR